MIIPIFNTIPKNEIDIIVSSIVDNYTREEQEQIISNIDLKIKIEVYPILKRRLIWLQ